MGLVSSLCIVDTRMDDTKDWTVQYKVRKGLVREVREGKGREGKEQWL